jgi:hypothetical protein
MVVERCDDGNDVDDDVAQGEDAYGAEKKFAVDVERT